MKFLLKHLQIALLSVFALAAAPAAHAQININPPSWGPTVPAGAQYYYIPEASSFYDVPARQYVVSRDGRWIRTTTLDGYNTANFHPVIIDYVGAQPWTRYDEYRNRYPRGGNPSNGGLPPGQAKKMYRRGYQNGQYDDRRNEHRDDDRRNERRDDDRRNERRDDDRRYERRDDERRDDRRDDDHDDDQGKYKNKGKGKKDKD